MSWDFWGNDGFYIGPALHHYRTFSVISKETKRQQFSDTAEFCHSYLTQPSLTSKGRITHTMSILACALIELPTATYNTQLDAITNLRDLFSQWQGDE